MDWPAAIWPVGSRCSRPGSPAGRARDGHGDLLADDIFLLDDGPRVLDCLEFDDALRLDDVLADVAFLAMDLERLGRPDLAERFLAAYRAASGDTWPSSLAHHHIAYRAQVRAKVSAIRAEQGVPDSADKAQALLRLALAHLEAGRVRLVLVGGLPGTGKSTARSRHRRGERRGRPALRRRAQGTGRSRIGPARRRRLRTWHLHPRQRRRRCTASCCAALGTR